MYFGAKLFFSAFELQAVKPGLPLSLGLFPAHFPEEKAELWRVCGTFRGTLAADDRIGDRTQVPCQRASCVFSPVQIFMKHFSSFP